MESAIPRPPHSDKLKCLDCHEHSGMFLLKNEVWLEATKEGERKHWICVNCIQKRLGRFLNIDDFNRGSKFNDIIWFAFDMGRR